mmetsp:Transcript_35669/g.68403  ORF Transcript_35669/g.68403 Transcript_35669/m.68403 type:complete len:301 (-) Transcript_35669:286-1188(-)
MNLPRLLPRLGRTVSASEVLRERGSIRIVQPICSRIRQFHHAHATPKFVQPTQLIGTRHSQDSACTTPSRSFGFASRTTAGSIASQEGGVESQHIVWPRGGGLVHSSACVHPSVLVQVGAVIHENVQVAEGCVIGSGCVLGPDVIVGKATTLSYNVALSNCVIGENCVFHNGVCIGQDGFGFFVDEQTGVVVKKPQELGVRIGSNVEVGANTCVDRGSWRDTVIGDNVKIDNLVQVGHNVNIGHSCFLCGHVALGGSSTLGDYVVMGGKSAVADHVSVCSKVLDMPSCSGGSVLPRPFLC